MTFFRRLSTSSSSQVSDWRFCFHSSRLVDGFGLRIIFDAAGPGDVGGEGFRVDPGLVADRPGVIHAGFEPGAAGLQEAAGPGADVAVADQAATEFGQIHTHAGEQAGVSQDSIQFRCQAV
jgi:hypothetical protein